MMMEAATYIGTKIELAGETALIRPDPLVPDGVLAQFDRFDLKLRGIPMASGWHPFAREDFHVS